MCACAGKLRATFDVYSDGLFALPLSFVPGSKFWRALRARQAILDVMERARPTLHGMVYASPLHTSPLHITSECNVAQ